jgi:hypothetical protein
MQLPAASAPARGAQTWHAHGLFSCSPHFFIPSHWASGVVAILFHPDWAVRRAAGLKVAHFLPGSSRAVVSALLQALETYTLDAWKARQENPSKTGTDLVEAAIGGGGSRGPGVPSLARSGGQLTVILGGFCLGFGSRR